MMTQEESRETALEKPDEKRSSLPAVSEEETMDLRLKMQYFGSVAVPSAILLEIMGAQAAGLGLAAGLGVAAAYFAPELHTIVEPTLRTAGKVLAAMRAGRSNRLANRLTDKGWWLGQEPTTVYVDEEEESGEEEPDDLYAGLTDEELARLREIEEAERKGPRQRRQVVDLAEGLSIRRDDLAGKAIFICGIRRHGKTTLGARLAEQMGKVHHLPMLIPDLEGDYLSLADVLPRVVIAGAGSAAGEYRQYAFEALDSAEAARQLGYDLLEVGYQVILDMISYDQLDTAVMMQVALIEGMFRWAKEHPDERVPAYVYLDEAQRFLPQTLSDSVIKDRKMLQALLDAYMDIIAIGGKRGINPVILTQRFAQTNNKIMAQSEVFFLLRQTHDTDLERCMEYASSPMTRKQISLFKPGEGVYISADGTQTVAQFKQRESSGKRSKTPQATSAERYASMPMTRPAARRAGSPAPVIREPEATRASQPHEQAYATIQRILSLYEEGRISQELFERLLNSIPVGAASSSEEEPEEEPQTARADDAGQQPIDMELERAIAVYREGATSINKLAAAMSIKPYYAGPLLERVKKAIQKRAANE